MPTPERMKELLQGLQKADPSAAWIDSLAASKERIAQGTATGVDSARVFMGRQPDKPLTPAQQQKAEADSLKAYISKMESQEKIAAAQKRGAFLKPEKPPKGESLTDARMGYIQTLDKLTTLHSKTVDLGDGELGYQFPEGTAERRVLEDKIETTRKALAFTEKAKALGVTKNFNQVVTALNKLKKIKPKFHLIRTDKGDKAADEFLFEETGLTREQARNFYDTFSNE